jgi:hypothetical protein
MDLHSASAGIFDFFDKTRQDEESISNREAKDKQLNKKLLNLNPNTWVKVHQPIFSDWRRQAHAGIIYDSKRGTLLIFGSNTHKMDWDNSVHEFNPFTLKWTTHYPSALKETYRADNKGHAISGNDRLLPWAMHTYDNILYDPKLDSLVVNALPEHNYIKKRIPAVIIHPTWLYSLQTHTWSIFPNNDKPYPKFFAGATEYDEARDTIVSYNNSGVWELGSKRDEWKKATGGKHQIHYSMVYDSKRKNFAVFGDYHNTNAVWIYTPGSGAGAQANWVKKEPDGDFCTPDQAFPVAYDRDNDVFLLITRNRKKLIDKKGRVKWGKAKSSSTYIYNPDTNKYHKLLDEDMTTLRMNYMMTYDRFHKIFLLVTGDWRKPAEVWALKLEPDKLKINPTSDID